MFLADAQIVNPLKYDMQTYYDSHLAQRAIYQARVAALIKEKHLIIEA